MDVYFKAKLTDLRGGSASGEQFLTVELSDGSLLNLWDPEFFVSKNMLGKNIRLIVYLDSGNVPSCKVERISANFKVPQKAGPIEGRIGGLLKTTEGIFKGTLSGFIDVKVAKFNFIHLPDRGGFRDGDFVKIYDLYPGQPVTGPALVVRSAELVGN